MAKFIVVIIFYIFTSTVFYIVHFDKEFVGNLAHHIFNEFNCFVILISYLDVFDGKIIVSANLLVKLIEANGVFLNICLGKKYEIDLFFI